MGKMNVTVRGSQGTVCDSLTEKVQKYHLISHWVNPIIRNSWFFPTIATIDIFPASSLSQCEKNVPFLLLLFSNLPPNYYLQSEDLSNSLPLKKLSPGACLVWERFGGKEQPLDPGEAGTAQPCEENYVKVKLLLPPTAGFCPDPQFYPGKTQKFCFSRSNLFLI